jgi:hypothetical protein
MKFYLNIFMWGSCFEAFVIRNTMVQSGFNLDTRFSSYNFFLVYKSIHCAVMSAILFLLFVGAQRSTCPTQLSSPLRALLLATAEIFRRTGSGNVWAGNLMDRAFDPP